jgi:hypothetical protein
MDIPPVIPACDKQTMAVPPKLPDEAFRAPQAPPRLPPPLPPYAKASNAAPPATRPSPLLTPKQRFRRLVIAIASATVLIAACALTYEKYYTPKHSILALASAVDRRDRDMVTEYVDAPALAESFHRFALESFNRENAKTSTNLFDHLVQPLLSQMADGLASATFTPESTIDILCGESPTDAMKEGLGNAADNTVDTFTKDGTPKTKVYGGVTKALVRCVSGYAVDEAAADSKGKQTEMNLNDYEITTQYESLNRYLIKLTPRNSGDPAIGYVFKRHGLGTWKWSELRLMPQSKHQTVAAR